MNVIIYDEASMIKFVKSIEPHPVLYDNTNPDFYSRRKQNESWEKVAKEMGDDITLCRDKWKNVKACYTRYLRRIHYGVNSSREYYLAQYLHFLTPFISFGSKNKNKPGSFEDGSQSSILHGIDLDYHSDEYVKSRIRPEASTSNEIMLTVAKSNFKRKRNESDSISTAKQKQKADDEGQINFFRSLLPEISRMTNKQKLSFKQTVLATVQDILFNSNDLTK